MDGAGKSDFSPHISESENRAGNRDGTRVRSPVVSGSRAAVCLRARSRRAEIKGSPKLERTRGRHSAEVYGQVRTAHLDELVAEALGCRGRVSSKTGAWAWAWRSCFISEPQRHTG